MTFNETTNISHILLIFAGRRPRVGMIETLCKTASIQGSRLTIVRVWTIFSKLTLLIGGQTAKADLNWVVGITDDLGIKCETRIHRSRTYPESIIQLTNELTPDLVCVVPAAIGNGQGMRRAIGIAGRAVEGRLVIDQSLS